MATNTHAARCESGDAWLASCSLRPNLVRDVWDMDGLAPIHTGTHWLAAEARLDAAMSVLRDLPRTRRGPLLADPMIGAAWWLVPLDAAEQLADVRALTVHPPDWPLHCPPTGWPVCGRVWLDRPDGSGRLTNPATLGAVFGPGRGPRLPAEAFG
ncbi:hypothetical protein U9R90_24875 [Streptomyces sp. E11-3]|uniref:hypothetical protein n=1 Tax=Streptomyces sp. E11-3 TaxID=3110112 RepID=UPI0039803A9A